MTGRTKLMRLLAMRALAARRGPCARRAVHLGAALLWLLAAAPAAAADSFGVLGVADPPAGPDAELAEMTHQLRGACRDRVGGVLEVPEMRPRLLGQPGATLPELERAYAGARVAFDSGETEAAARSLRAMLGDLEKLPESAAAYAQWTRATVRLAYMEHVLKRHGAAAGLLERLAATDPHFGLDEVEYPPSFHKEWDEARRRVGSRRKARLVIGAGARPSAAFVNGRPVGKTPLVVPLPPGRYRVGGALGTLHAPNAYVELDGEDRAVELDFTVSDALRVNAGPGLAVAQAQRSAILVRAGGLLGVTRIVAASVVPEGGARFLSGALYDVQRGALLREGRTRMTAGSVSSVQMGALASFLLTGQASRDVTPVSTIPLSVADPSSGKLALVGPPVPPGMTLRLRPRHPWMRPAAYVAGALALGLGAGASWQAVEASRRYGAAKAMLRSEGVLAAGAEPGRYRSAIGAADSAQRNAYLLAGGAVAFAAAAGILGYLSFTDAGVPVVAF